MKRIFAVLTASFVCAATALTSHAHAGPTKPALPTGMPAESGPPLSGFVAAGGASRFLYDIPILGFEASAGLGPRDAAAQRFNFYASPRFFFGRTRAGLDVTEVTLGARAEYRFAGFAYAGANLAAGLLWLDRASSGGMTNATASASLFIGPELVLSDDVAIGIDVTGAAEYLPGADDTLMLGPGVELRVRFF